MQVVVDIYGRSVAKTEHAVVIAGGGPAGMMLAAELALAKVDVAVVERRPDHVLVGSRAGGFHSRTIEVLDQRGVADRFLAEGQVAQVATFGTTTLDMSDFPTRHPYSLGIWQNQIERIMADWIAELPVHIYYGCEVTGFAQDDTGVDVRLSDGESLRARYLVGCDGGRSLIRKAAGIEFPGWDPTKSNLIAEVEMTEEPELGIRRDEKGIHALGRLEYEIRDGEVIYKDEGPIRVMVTEEHVGAHDRADPARSERRADRRVRHRFRDPQPDLDLQVHRYDSAGRGLPRGTGPAGRRRGARALPRRWTGTQPRRAGCRQSGMEARAGGRRDLPGEPPGYLPGRASPGRCPRAQAHDGAGALQRRTSACRPWSRWCRSWRAWTSLANGSPGSSPGWTSTTTSARDTRCSAAACPISTSSPPTARSELFELLHEAGRVLLNLGGPGELRHHSMGRPGPADRR